MRDRKLPTSRLGRFARLAALGTRAGAGKLASMFGDPKAERSLAEAAADSLGAMRGLALKVGQMVSYVDGLVPPEHRDLYEQSMKRLRAAAPTMSVAAAARVVEQELGAPPDEVFASWQAEPFASASIGQVHRAVTRDGARVAVKVQFDGIASAVEADLANASLSGKLLGPLGARLGVREQLAEIRARFLEELDYRHEAARQLQFREVFQDDPRIRIPAVFDELSTRRVLTTALAPGAEFETACAADEAERRRWAETLWRFVFSSLLRKGLFNADPHPGNYLFEPDGVVTFLDFGCTRVLSRDHLRLVREAHRHACLGDVDGLCDIALTMFEMPKEGLAADVSRQFVRACFVPIHHQGPYRISRDYAAGLLEELRRSARLALRGKLVELEPLPAEWVFFNRLQFGFYSVLARLDVEADYNAIERELTSCPARS
ncbi:MAG: AarF/ABC1/UbiB kinase family protein [Deltaproteobacteria bacterium]|jgi:predicted unusual protein kinase regulating ubiquinone biosynthesis (AarF/ABC1/UbiB family)|nr:AarF/ABC1/UbiB kinase family protein [Deltaproteobacteria bacterium]MBW2536625.1 AarF/ABC1/UbiB kinase family protein [Deltaproteobacteria bacterium]